jgi:hypothetical protein
MRLDGSARDRFTDRPSPALLSRMCRESVEFNSRMHEKYAYPDARAERWPDGVPEHVEAMFVR